MKDFIKKCIQEILDEWTEKETQFTAYEVSREIRNRWDGSQGTCPRHAEIREIIHEKMRNYDYYNAVLMDVGAPSMAFVYYHETTDPKDYQPLNREMLNSVNPGRTAEVSVAPRQPNQNLEKPIDPTNKVPKNDKILVDFLLKSDDMGAAGFSPYDTVYIVPDKENQCVIVAADLPNNCFDFSCKTVSGNNEVQLNQEVFKKAGIAANKTYALLPDKAKRRIVCHLPVVD